MGDLVRLEVDQEEALEQVVVEHEVDVIFVDVGVDMLLAAYESEALAQFHDEPLHVEGEAAFEGFLGIALVLPEAEELNHHGVFDVLQVVLQGGGEAVHLVDDGLFGLRLEETEVVLRADVAVQHAGAPSLTEAFLLVPEAGFGVLDSDQLAVVRPGEQLLTRCVNYLCAGFRFWTRCVQNTHFLF